jgi:hypothetical protein
MPLAATAEVATTPGDSFDELAFLDAVVGRETAESRDGETTGSGSTKASHIPQRAAGSPGKPKSPPPAYESVIVRDDADAESLLAGLRDTGTRGSHEAPLAANVPANTPIVLRTSGALEQSKTLKCNECSAMNYPTEWYCERCGAELAAL